MPHKNKWLPELENIKRLGLEGKTFQQIANIYGVSRQRMKQVILKNIPEWDESYGKAVRDKKAHENFEQLVQKRTRKWGTPDRSKMTGDLYWTQRHKFYAKRANAKRAGYVWDLEFGDLEWPTHCPVFGFPLNYYSEGKSCDESPSFDQIVPGKGYIVGNVQIISWKANRLKNDGTWEDHQKIADYMKKISESSGNMS